MQDDVYSKLEPQAAAAGRRLGDLKKMVTAADPLGDRQRLLGHLGTGRFSAPGDPINNEDEQTIWLYSQAISLKRIADRLDTLCAVTADVGKQLSNIEINTRSHRL